MAERFLISLGAATLIFLALCAAVNGAIDPTGYLTNAGLLKPEYCTAGIRRMDVQSAPLSASAYQPETLFLGASQIALGIDIDDREVRNDVGRAFNLGIVASRMVDLVQALDAFSPEHPVPRLVIGVTGGMAHSENDDQLQLALGPAAIGGARLDAWASSDVVHDWRPVREFKTALLSMTTLKSALQALTSKVDCATPLRGLDGSYFTRTDMFDPHAVAARNALFLDTRFNIMNGSDALYRSNLENFRRLVALACSKADHVYVVQLPLHAELHEILLQIAGDDAEERWKRDSLAIVDAAAAANCDIENWDFAFDNATTTAEFTPEAISQSDFPFYEILHFRPTTGRRVIQTIFGTEDPAFGVRLEPNTLEAHLRDTRRAHLDWRASHRDLVEHIRQVGAERLAGN